MLSRPAMPVLEQRDAERELQNRDTERRCGVGWRRGSWEGARAGGVVWAAAGVCGAINAKQVSRITRNDTHFFWGGRAFAAD